MRPRRVECPEELAEGRCQGVPFSCDLYDVDSGPSIHFWMGRDVEDLRLLALLVDRATREVDPVLITYSDGAPRGFWASVEL